MWLVVQSPISIGCLFWSCKDISNIFLLPVTISQWRSLTALFCICYILETLPNILCMVYQSNICFTERVTVRFYLISNYVLLCSNQQSTVIGSSQPKYKKSPSRRGKSRWEPIAEEKLAEKIASVSQHPVKDASWDRLRERGKIVSFLLSYFHFSFKGPTTV